MRTRRDTVERVHHPVLFTTGYVIGRRTPFWRGCVDRQCVAFLVGVTFTHQS